MVSAGVAIASATLIDFDVQTFLFLNHALAAWLWPMVVLSAVGGGWGSLTVVPLLAFGRTRRFALSLTAVLGVTAVFVFALKRVVGRVRPCNCLADVKALFFAAPSDFSFPSGHSAGSFAFAVFVAIVLVRATPAGASASVRRLRRLSAGVLVALAASVGLSRIALGVHFPGDVLAGALLGTTIATLGARWHLAAARRAELVARDP